MFRFSLPSKGSNQQPDQPNSMSYATSVFLGSSRGLASGCGLFSPHSHGGSHRSKPIAPHHFSGAWGSLAEKAGSTNCSTNSLNHLRSNSYFLQQCPLRSSRFIPVALSVEVQRRLYAGMTPDALHSFWLDLRLVHKPTRK